MKTISNPAPTTLVPIRYALTTTALLASAGLASGGLVGPGGDAHIWDGSVNSSWQIGGNWTNGQVPGAGDQVVINGGPVNIFLNGDSANLASLFHSGGRVLTTNGHELSVRDSSGVLSVVGNNTVLFAASVPANEWSSDSDELNLESNGRLTLAAGRVRTDQLTMTGGATIVGNGLIRINSANPVSFNGLAGGPITVGSSGIDIIVTGGGAIALPDEINMLDIGADLNIEGPLFIPATDIDMGEDSLLTIAEDWALDGQLTANATPGGLATVRGGTANIEGSVVVSTGTLLFEDDVDFEGTASTVVGFQNTLEIDSSHDSFAGHETTIALQATMRVNGQQEIGHSWSGDIDVNGGSLEINGPQVLGWRLAGDLSFQTLLGNRPSIDGDATVISTGDFSATGDGVVLNTGFDFRPGNIMDLTSGQTELTVNDDFIFHNGNDLIGDGSVNISSHGSMTVVAPTNIDVDIYNGGVMSLRGPLIDPEYLYIDGEYEQTALGRLNVQIAGPANVEHDIYETSNAATFAGDLSVELIDGYVPVVGETFEVFFANGGINGAFDDLIGQPGFEVSYNGNVVVLEFVGACSADFTGDGVVDSTDLAMLLAAWGTPAGDINGDGTTDSADLAVMLAGWGMCP